MIRICRAEQLTIDVWDYIFYGKELPADGGIPEEALRLAIYVTLIP